MSPTLIQIRCNSIFDPGKRNGIRMRGSQRDMKNTATVTEATAGATFERLKSTTLEQEISPRFVQRRLFTVRISHTVTGCLHFSWVICASTVSIMSRTGIFTALFRTDAQRLFAKRYSNVNDSASRLLVTGEELVLSVEMITRENRCVDALWNDQFQKCVSAAIVGRSV